MHASDVGPKVEDDAYRRAVRSVPGSGEIWARYIRFSVIFSTCLVLSFQTCHRSVWLLKAWKISLKEKLQYQVRSPYLIVCKV
jgi:hypothetical protein